MMKILLAPDSFKGSLTALEAAECMEKGIKRVFPDAETVKLPMADGGEGTVQSLVDATGGELVGETVTGPLGKRVKAQFGLLGDGKTAVIEMASASGFILVPREKADPMVTTTFGTGELIKAALDKGVEEIIIGIGGSATTDGGVGMAQALGVRFLDENGEEIGFGGGELARLARIDLSGLDSRIKDTGITTASDVDNPLCGENGAAYVYGPQKGATPEMVELLDNNLRHYSEVLKRDTGADVADIPGAGAAGGLGAGLMAFLNARLKPGIEIVLEASKFEEKLAGVELVITGEGQLDKTSARGKTPVGVALTAGKHGIPVVAVSGSIGDELEVVHEKGIDAAFDIVRRPVPLKEAVGFSAEWLSLCVEEIMRLIKTAGKFYGAGD